MKPLYSPDTAVQLEQLSAVLPHAVLLQGPVGVGLLTAARFLASNSLEDIIMPTTREGTPDPTSQGVIRAKQIRQLVERASTKTRVRRVYIIDDADQMNTTAQNAFLKLLEEPASHTHFILTSHRPHALLATIRSRVQTTRIEQLSVDQSKELLDVLNVRQPSTVQQMLFLASGLPAQLTRLASDTDYFERESIATRDARVFLQGTPLEQLSVVETYQKNRDDTLRLLLAAERILLFSLRRQPSQDIVHKLATLALCYDHVAANGNSRLQLMTCIISA